MSTSKMSSARSVLYSVALVAAGLSIPACSCSSEPIPNVPDTGLHPDGSMPDANVDTGPRPDTGPMPDVGPMPDTGTTIDTGTTTDTGPMPDAAMTCGNGVVDTGETCDTAITSGTGACPTSCDDSMACTTDAFAGADCTTSCTHTAIAAGPADGCCPSGATLATDPDCSASCGDGVVSAGETCDTAITSGTGSCPTTCDDGIACTMDVTIGSACTTACAHNPITTASGTTMDGCCPTGATSGTDVDCPASCGNGVVDAGETCDTGIASGAGSCPTSCNDGVACTTDMLVSGGTCMATCSFTPITATVNGDSCCPPGANHNTDTDCAPMCGNGVVEGPTETCEPPGTSTCSATCQTIVAACGNGTLDAGEDCDDSNRRNLDGCDSNCHYEAFSRLTDLQISAMMAPAACTPRTNQLGAVAITGTALGQLNGPLRTDVQNGTINILLQALGLTDLTGVTDPSFTIGVMNGTPDPAAGTWPAAGNPIDWRFFIDHNTVDTMGLPTTIISPASSTARALRAGPSSLSLTVTLGGTPSALQLFSAHVIGTIGTTVSHPPYPTSLRSTLTAFETITGNTDGTNGLCGNISVASLAAIPAPMVITSGGSFACRATTGSHTYTYCGAGNPVGPTCNSLLDVLVGGCKVTILNVVAIRPTQPDVAGPGGLFPLANSGALNKVTVPAGDTDSYSSYFLFTANRAHASGESCTAAAQCQSGQACTGGVCI